VAAGARAGSRKKLVKEVEEVVAGSLLQEKVGKTAISKLVAQVHLEFWKK